MQTRTVEELIRDFQQRREVGDPPPVLLLGAGASTFGLCGRPIVLLVALAGYAAMSFGQRNTDGAGLHPSPTLSGSITR